LPAAAAGRSSIAQDRVKPPSVRTPAWAHDCIANLSQHVTVYAPGRESVIGTIARGINQPVSLALDAAGGLFVGNDAHSLIRVYDPTTHKLLRTISSGISQPVSLAFDHQQNLYAANFCCGTAVTVYAAGGTQLLRTISDGVSEPNSLAFDRAGRPYVSNLPNKSVTVYSSRTGKLIRTISDGVAGSDRLAFDTSGNLYAANVSYNNVRFTPRAVPIRSKPFLKALVIRKRSRSTRPVISTSRTIRRTQ
jgi:sugar lactone lactonase YvrE